MEFDEPSENRMMRAYSIMNRLGRDSQNYLSLHEESEFYFGSEVDGLVAYSLSGKKAMSLGDPVCRAADLAKLTQEYVQFCRANGWKPVFNSVSREMVETLESLDLEVIKYGEEPILRLSEYSLAGKNRSALRRNLSKVRRSGATLIEYCPQQNRDDELEQKIDDLARRWQANKGRNLGYTVGSLDFDEPYDRRFFLTIGEDGNLLTALSLLPYEEANGYCVDVMYRDFDAVTGAMEHAIIESAFQLKDDGVEDLSLGIAPLAGIDPSKPGVSRTEKIMNAIFHEMDAEYNFKGLYRFKKKFGPNIWKPRYLAYDKRVSLPGLALSLNHTKRGSGSLGLYFRYKYFGMAVALGLRRVRED